MSEPYLPPEDVAAGGIHGVEQQGGRQQKPGAFVNIGKLFVAGTVGGLVECTVSYPLETVKTRMQTQPAGAAGALSCFATAIREDGALSLYRGVSSRVATSMIAASVMFGANGTLKELFRADSHKPLSVRFIAAAAGTGVLEAIAYCPLELVKTRMQVMRGSPPPGVTVWSTALRIYRQHGIFKGSYRGFSSLLMREGLGNSVYFGSYELCKQVLATGAGASGSGHQTGVFTIAASGGVAGVLYAVATHPLDTVKSLVQTDSMEAPRYRGFVDGFKQAVGSGGGGFKGFTKLYRGLSPAVGRSFVGNAALFLTFEKVLDGLGR